ncbi:aldo/keto reductase [Niastella yeongjuensis]|uniref:Aldo/keto reductase n=1 Tax=Niastella yeongjuensis TaxID=354355 RepID=A0A1V9E4I9_9BACT|nr:aldo/keto reductase [Niastella yeongjuensis]OQP40835.1 aldo/keto reductase [Niastella yeongjuensis]SEP00154.1 Predicted oxidoreductase [Niastella yeongjuensis]
MELSHYRTLGHSGLRVSPATLGAMTFGTEWGWGASPEESKAVLAAYLQKGGNIIDTANLYTKGHSEKIIGDYIRETNTRRDRLVLSTKYSSSMHPADPNSGGTGRKATIMSLEASLRRLQTDYIDLYWVHGYDANTPIEETMSALYDMVKAGKVRYIAVSDTPAWKVAQSQMIAAFRGWSAFIGLQVEYNLLERTVEGDSIPMAQELGLGVMPWSPLKGGILSGKYTRANNGQSQNGRRAAEQLPETTLVVLDRLAKIAETRNVPVAAISLAWVMGRPGITSTIIGARTLAQLENNLQALTITLTDDEVKFLDEVTMPVLGFPTVLIDTMAVHAAQGGTTVNGKTSIRFPILPQSDEDGY